MNHLFSVICMFALLSSCHGIVPEHATKMSIRLSERGDSLLANAKTELALKSYKLALKYDRNNHRAWMGIGVAIMSRSPEDSLLFLRKALKIKDDSVETIANIGVLFMKQGKIDDALKMFKRALIFNPGFFTANYNLALIYISRNKFRLAFDHAARVWLMNKSPEVEEFYVFSSMKAGIEDPCRKYLIKKQPVRSVFGYLIHAESVKYINPDASEILIAEAKRRYPDSFVLKNLK